MDANLRIRCKMEPMHIRKYNTCTGEEVSADVKVHTLNILFQNLYDYVVKYMGEDDYTKFVHQEFCDAVAIYKDSPDAAKIVERRKIAEEEAKIHNDRCYRVGFPPKRDPAADLKWALTSPYSAFRSCFEMDSKPTLRSKALDTEYDKSSKTVPTGGSGDNQSLPNVPMDTVYKMSHRLTLTNREPLKYMDDSVKLRSPSQLRKPYDPDWQRLALPTYNRPMEIQQQKNSATAEDVAKKPSAKWYEDPLYISPKDLAKKLDTLIAETKEIRMQTDRKTKEVAAMSDEMSEMMNDLKKKAARVLGSQKCYALPPTITTDIYPLSSTNDTTAKTTSSDACESTTSVTSTESLTMTTVYPASSFGNELQDSTSSFSPEITTTESTVKISPAQNHRHVVNKRDFKSQVKVLWGAINQMKDQLSISESSSQMTSKASKVVPTEDEEAKNKTGKQKVKHIGQKQSYLSRKQNNLIDHKDTIAEQKAHAIKPLQQLVVPQHKPKSVRPRTQSLSKQSTMPSTLPHTAKRKLTSVNENTSGLRKQYMAKTGVNKTSPFVSKVSAGKAQAKGIERPRQAWAEAPTTKKPKEFFNPVKKVVEAVTSRNKGTPVKKFKQSAPNSVKNQVVNAKEKILTKCKDLKSKSNDHKQQKSKKKGKAQPLEKTKNLERNSEANNEAKCGRKTQEAKKHKPLTRAKQMVAGKISDVKQKVKNNIPKKNQLNELCPADIVKPKQKAKIPTRQLPDDTTFDLSDLPLDCAQHSSIYSHINSCTTGRNNDDSPIPSISEHHKLNHTAVPKNYMPKYPPKGCMPKHLAISTSQFSPASSYTSQLLTNTFNYNHSPIPSESDYEILDHNTVPRDSMPRQQDDYNSTTYHYSTTPSDSKVSSISSYTPYLYSYSPMHSLSVDDNMNFSDVPKDHLQMNAPGGSTPTETDISSSTKYHHYSSALSESKFSPTSSYTPSYDNYSTIRSVSQYENVNHPGVPENYFSMDARKNHSPTNVNVMLYINNTYS